MENSIQKIQKSNVLLKQAESTKQTESNNQSEFKYANIIRLFLKYSGTGKNGIKIVFLI